MTTTRRGRGEGSIYQRHDHPTCPPLVDGERAEHKCKGRYVATISYGSDGTKRDRKPLYGKTKGEVSDKLKAALKKAPPKNAREGEKHTVKTWMNEWLEDIASAPPKPIRKSTKKSHRSKIDQYIVPLIGMHRLDRLEAKHIRRMYVRMQEPCPTPDPKTGKCHHSPSHGLSESTARQTHVILARALKVAVREKLILEAETSNVDAPGTKTTERDRLTVAQAKLVLAAGADNPLISRWYAALQMGFRQSEVLGLPWGLVNFEENTVTIARTLEDDGTFGVPKSDAGNRTVVMFPEFRAHLMAHYGAYLARCHENGTEPDPMACVWSQDNGRPIGHKTDWNRWAAFLKASGVDHHALHSARQTTASWLEELGWPERVAAEFLGHADVKQTYKYQRGDSLGAQRRAMGELES
ncbi:tyrosine-type recombinase/integrase [Aeromicrobium sp.]|uniref:tyrosine-type recombinase/integrase n=1 Tax=Aeromicrobium sp. TaxID=1871063 RepID=UPI002FC94EAE